MCNEETKHKVLKGKLGKRRDITFDATVQCSQCYHVHHVLIKEKKPISVRVIVSWLDKSKKKRIQLDPDDVIKLGTELQMDEYPILITGIESEGRRVKSAKASAITTLWAKRFDKVQVHFSIPKGSRTLSKTILAVPDEEFSIGDIVDIDRKAVVVCKIKTEDRMVTRGSAMASEIVRIYGKFLRG